MVAVFSGFVAGRVPGLQQLGLGLALGVLIDATVVRLLLVPSLVYLGGRRSWWLPAPIARLVRVSPSPLRPASASVGEGRDAPPPDELVYSTTVIARR